MQRQYGGKGDSATTDLRIWECGGNNYEKRLPRNKNYQQATETVVFLPKGQVR